MRADLGRRGEPFGKALTGPNANKVHFCIIRRHSGDGKARRALLVRAEQHTGGCSRRQAVGSILSTAGLLHGLPRKAMATSDGGESLLEQKTTEFTLNNGLHFIVLERHTAPIVSVHTYSNVGAFQEADGQTGLAHMLEHEAFKGSSRIGTSDWSREKPLLEAQDEVFYMLREAMRKGMPGHVKRLEEKLAALQTEASQYTVPNDFGARLTQAGAVGLNASTSHDATRYVASLPSNVLELWFALESERFKDPVFRELYSEKRVVLEERRSRVDNAPLGKFREKFSLQAFANAYRRPVIGFQEDIEAFGRLEVDEFFRQHYVPTNLTIAIVGDTTPDQVQQFAEKYFGSWYPQQLAYPDEPDAVKPRGSSRRLEQPGRAGPVLMQAFYRGTVNSQDAIRLEVIADVLAGGRTARLERNLVQTGTAFATSFLPAFPGDKHPCASLLYSIPSQGVSLQKLETAVRNQLEELASSGVTENEMLRIRKAAKVEAVEAIRFNASMAGSLCAYHALTGSWKTLLTDLSSIDTISTEDVRQTAESLFRESNTFTGVVLPLDA